MRPVRETAGLLWMYGGQLLLIVAQVLALTVLSRLLNKDDFGIAAVIVTLSELVAWLTTCGVGPAIVQLPTISPSHYSTALMVALLGGLAGAFMSQLLASQIAAFFGIQSQQHIMRWLLLACPLATIRLIFHSMMQRNRFFQWLSSIQAMSYVIGPTVCSIALAANGLGAHALIVGQLVFQFLLITSYGYMMMRFLRPVEPPSVKSLSELLRIGLGFGWAELLGWTANNADRLLISHLLDVQSLGIYTRAYAIFQAVLTFLTQPMEVVLFPAFASVQHQKDAVQRLYNKGILLVCLLCTPIVVVLLSVPDRVIHVLLGPGWEGAVPVLRIFALFLLVRVLYRVVDFVVRGHGWVYRRLFIVALFSLASLVGMLIGARYGLAGIAVGVGIAYFVPFLFLSLVAVKGLGWNWRWYFGISTVPCFVAVGSTVWVYPITKITQTVPDLLELIILGLWAVVGTVVWLSLLRLSGVGPVSLVSDIELGGVIQTVRQKLRWP